MKHLSLTEVEVMRLAAEDNIRRAVQEFFEKTGLPLEVNIITQSVPTHCGKIFSVDVKTKATIE